MFKRILKYWLMRRYPLTEPKRLWQEHPELGMVLHWDHQRSEPAVTYQRLLTHLIKTQRFDFRAMRDLRRPCPDKISVGLRHDIDNDISTALKLAKIEHQLGLQASYYVLHTAPYYGSRPCISILKEIQALGHEVGLHNDCLKALVELGTPVADTLKQTLDLLRSQGLTITGTASHGSYHTYLAANYEIFEGLSIHGRRSFGDQYPLGHLKMQEFGLEYEANYIKKSILVSKAFYDSVHQGYYQCPAEETDWVERDYDAQYGIFGRNFWLGTDEHGPTVSVLTADESLNALLSHQAGERIVLDSHPEYYGYSPNRARIQAALSR